MDKLPYYLIAFIVGLIIALHLSMNADVGAKLGNPRAANAVFWCVGAVVAVAIWLAGPNRGAIRGLKDVNPALLLSGALGAALVLLLAVIIPRIGAGHTNVVLLSGQVIAGLIIAHFAWLSSAQVSITPLRLMGVAVMIAGSVVAVAL